MRSLLAKLCGRAGETLVETLAAVLVCGIAAALLMTSIGSASSMNLDARTVTRQVERQEDNAARFGGYLDESGQAASSTGEVTVADRDASGYSETFDGDDVKVYGGPLIVSYEVAEGEA